jgi:hypothetical protein
MTFEVESRRKEWNWTLPDLHHRNQGVFALLET